MDTQISPTLDRNDLEQKVKHMYKEVAEHPKGSYHFEIGRQLAEKLGYTKEDLNRIPPESVASFAGVGYFFDLADVRASDTVLDLGSGSGMDAFLASLSGAKVHGLDMTDEQLDKARNLARNYNCSNVSFHKGYIEHLPFEDRSFDLVISNGVINLSPDKEKVFREIYRVLKPGGRLAIADIISDKQMPEKIICDATLWASCIGGASRTDDYFTMIGSAGLVVEEQRDNERYNFLSKSAQSASAKYGVKSISILAKKPKM
jgi:ubiquinone/menaquinone biosynthesis C-methylase UbiE